MDAIHRTSFKYFFFSKNYRYNWQGGYVQKSMYVLQSQIDNTIRLRYAIMWHKKHSVMSQMYLYDILREALNSKVGQSIAKPLCSHRCACNAQIHLNIYLILRVQSCRAAELRVGSARASALDIRVT